MADLETTTNQADNTEEKSISDNASQLYIHEGLTDLTVVKGIGEKFQSKLHDMDILNLYDLANMSKNDIERTANSLSIAMDKIVNEDWIGQARELL